MNVKNLLTVGLLVFVAAAMVTIVVREGGGKDSPDTPTVATAAAQLPADGLVAYYFHGEIRCPTCKKIEAYAHESLQAGFPKEWNSGAIAWRVLNYEASANDHYVTEYEIAAPTVVLVRTSHGQPEDWRNLTRVWELAGDKGAFMKYIQEQARALLTKKES